jgi:hypothetical protein
MEIAEITSSNFICLTARYPYDEEFKFKETVMFTEQDLNIPLNDSLKDINDQKINNFSNLILTKNDLLTSSFFVDPLEYLYDYGFSTYFAANAPGTITPSTKFWVVEEPGVGVNRAELNVDGEYSNINNQYFFDVSFLSENFCKVSHENSNVKRYLTVDYTGNLSFCKDAELDSLGEYSPQIFLYIYDRDFKFIVLFKNINDIANYVTFNANNNNLTLAEPLTGTSIPYSISSIFRINPRSKSPNNTKFIDPWMSYKKDLFTNSQNVYPLRSFENIESNLLLNNEYFNLSSSSMDFNILSLKNSSNSDNYQGRGNPFFNEKNVQFRDYQSLFTGSNQQYGDDNVSLGYETYTTNILLKKDSVTYFHIPQNFYPFERLNVNDSYLAESGAIAGDHPLKSDKIFKKKGDYSRTTHFGDTIEETTGEFLCAWLSGSLDPNVRPIWVDRYYNPKNISFLRALTSSDFKAVRYISVFDCLVSEANQILGDVDVFDKPSDLIFEKGAYYAYHHYGPKDVENFINIFSKNLAQKDLINYKYYNGSDVQEILTGEYSFNGVKYASTGSLSAINNTNQFTLIFDGYSADWTVPLGNQIIGNYSSDGFGIFNQQSVTPFVFYNTLSSLNIANTDLTVLSRLETDSKIRGVIRTQSLDDFYILFEDNSVRRYNLSFSEIRRTSTNLKIGQSRDFTNTEDYAYFFFNNNPGGTPNMKLARADLNSNVITDYTANADFTNVPFDTLITFCNTVNIYNGDFYYTDGTKSEIIDNNIFYLTGNKIKLWSNINTVSTLITAFSASTSIEDFTIDYDNNIWILFDRNKYAKYNRYREFLLSGYFSDTNFANYKIDSLAEFKQGQYIKEMIVMRQSTSSNNTINFTKIGIDGLSAFGTQSTYLTAGFNNLTNGEFLRVNNQANYTPGNFSAKVKLYNMYNINSSTTAEVKFNLSAVDPGYHNFAIRFDAYEGFMHLFVDGQLQDVAEFDPRKYRFSNIINRPFLVGTSTYLNSIPLFNFLQNTNYLATNLKIKNFYLYDKPLYNYDIIMHTRKNMFIRDINLNVACGRRNYVEEVERYFKLRSPGSKSTLFNLIIRNSGIQDEDLKYALEQRILSILRNTAPVYTQIKNIKWAN